jgi:hypothetical protein
MPAMQLELRSIQLSSPRHLAPRVGAFRAKALSTMSVRAAGAVALAYRVDPDDLQNVAAFDPVAAATDFEAPEAASKARDSERHEESRSVEPHAEGAGASLNGAGPDSRPDEDEPLRRDHRGSPRREHDYCADDRRETEDPTSKSIGGEPRGLFHTPAADRMGDPELLDPEAIKRELGPPVRFAQHVMILADQRLQAGAPRADAIAFMAGFYLGVRDLDYARRALREFGPASGILDIYPLELVDHLLGRAPEFLRVERRAFLGIDGGRLVVRAGEATLLRYPAELRLRGFAIQGGDRPGYRLEPGEARGTHELAFDRPGRFTVLVSAIGPDSATWMETLAVEVQPGAERQALTAPEPRRTATRSGPGVDLSREIAGRRAASPFPSLRASEEAATLRRTQRTVAPATATARPARAAGTRAPLASSLLKIRA